MRRSRTEPWPFSPRHAAYHVEFYREELIKHHRCLQRQREYYSEGAYASAERALTRLLAELDQVCRGKDAERVMGHLLRQFDLITGLSAWSDPKKVN
jgi:hypothetical protein